MPEQVKFALQLPAHTISVAIAREAVKVLDRIVDPRRVEVAQLCLSELVTNAVRHGSPRASDVVDVEVTADSRGLCAVVCDSGPAFRIDAARREPDQPGGFGLLIARRLSDLTIDRSDHGNVVSFTVPIDESMTAEEP